MSSKAPRRGPRRRLGQTLLRCAYPAFICVHSHNEPEGDPSRASDRPIAEYPYAELGSRATSVSAAARQRRNSQKASIALSM
jgi:hypothetical protein